MKKQLGVLMVLATPVLAHAGGFGGIGLDQFMVQFVSLALGLGFVGAVVGLVGFAVSRMENNFGHILSGFVGLFSAAGMIGGGLVILGVLGVVAGGTLS